MKFPIDVIVDVNRINEKIEQYISQNGIDPYIFMNKDTATAIANAFGDIEFLDHSSKPNYAEYNGCKLFINNDLRFGIVEIR